MGEQGARPTNRPPPRTSLPHVQAGRGGLRAGAVGFTTTRTVLHQIRTASWPPAPPPRSRSSLGLGRARRGGHRRVRWASDMIDPTPEFEWMIEICGEPGVRSPSGASRTTSDPSGGGLLDRAADATPPGRASSRRSPGARRACCSASRVVGAPVHHPQGVPRDRHLPLAERVAQLRTPERREAILSRRSPGPASAPYLLSSFPKLFPLGDPPDYEPAPLNAARRRHRGAEGDGPKRSPTT